MTDDSDKPKPAEPAKPSEAAEAAKPEAVPAAPVLPTPEEAALETARIVSEMVDIDSESGAVIVAAAAAGAAIAAAPASDDTRHADPATTLRLSRERILRAISEDDRARPASEPGAGEAERAIDPVAIAAAAITRLRRRATTDLAELREQYHRLDGLVVLFAFVIIVVAGRLHRDMVTPDVQTFNHQGLTFDHPAGWISSPLALPAPRIAHDPSGTVPHDDGVYHVELDSLGSRARIEVLIDHKPAWSNIQIGLDLARRTRFGEQYALESTTIRTIDDHDWFRTGFVYADIAEQRVPERAGFAAVEYATIDRDQLYVVTLFGTPRELGVMEADVAPTLRVQSDIALLTSQTTALTQRKFPREVGRAFDSTVMVVVADLIDGRLRVRGAGSGVIVGADGSILTAYHVLHGQDPRLHDVFVIARYKSPDSPPQLQCAGRPSRSRFLVDRDLALIKCDLDLDGRTWNPATSGGLWPTLPDARGSELKVGQLVWVLGYPESDGGGLTLSQGNVQGWTGIDGATGRDYIKTDASITHGNSGGPVVDDDGRLVGIATAFRSTATDAGGTTELSHTGLVRPIQLASPLLDFAATGWIPREGYNSGDVAPSAVEAAPEGVRIYTTVIDHATKAPIRDANVVVLRAGIAASAIDMNRLDDQTLAWGRTNTQGEVRLKQLVPPGDYSVIVLAAGFEPLIGDRELHIDANTPPRIDPWTTIELLAR